MYLAFHTPLLHTHCTHVQSTNVVGPVMYARPVVPPKLSFGHGSVAGLKHPGGWPRSAKLPHHKGYLQKDTPKPYVCDLVGKCTDYDEDGFFTCVCMTSPNGSLWDPVRGRSRQRCTGFSFDLSKKKLDPAPYAERERALITLSSHGYTRICHKCADVLLMFDYMPGAEKVERLKQINDRGLIKELQIINEQECTSSKLRDVGYSAGRNLFSLNEELFSIYKERVVVDGEMAQRIEVLKQQIAHRRVADNFNKREKARLAREEWLAGFTESARYQIVMRELWGDREFGLVRSLRE